MGVIFTLGHDALTCIIIVFVIMVKAML